MARKIFSAIVLLLFCAFSSVSAYADSFEGIKGQVKEGVAIVHTHNTDSTDGFGTCFAVGLPQKDVFYFITNFHCVSTDEVVPNEENLILSSYESIGYPAEVVFFDPIQDYAVLKTDMPVKDIIPLKLSKDNIFENQEIFILGYPSEAMDVEVDQYGNVIYDEKGNKSYIKNPSNIITTTGEITSLEGEGNPKVNSFTTSAHVNNGNSGGPIIDKETGAVIGVVYAKGKEFESVSYGIEINQIINSLDALEIEYTNFFSKDYLINNTILPIVLTFLVLIIVLLLWLYYKKRDKQDIKSSNINLSSIETKIYGNYYTIETYRGEKDKNNVLLSPIQMPENSQITVGKGENCDIRIIDDTDKYIADLHFCIEFKEKGYIIVRNLNDDFNVCIKHMGKDADTTIVKNKNDSHKLLINDSVFVFIGSDEYFIAISYYN